MTSPNEGRRTREGRVEQRPDRCTARGWLQKSTWSGFGLGLSLLLLVGGSADRALAQYHTRDPIDGLDRTRGGEIIHPCRAEVTELRACGADETTGTPVGRLSTLCQLTGPRLEATTSQRGNPAMPVLAAAGFGIPPYGAPGGWFSSRPSCWPASDPQFPFQLEITNLQLTYPPNASCDLDSEGITKCEPFYDHRRICPEGGRVTGGDLGVPVAFQNRLWFLFGDVSDRDAVARDDDHNIVPARSVQDLDDIDLGQQPCIAIEPVRSECSDLDFQLRGVTLSGSSAGHPPGGCDEPGCVLYKECSIVAGRDANDPSPAQDVVVAGTGQTTLIAEKRILLKPGVRILPRESIDSVFRAAIEPPVGGSLKHGIADDVLVGFMDGLLEDHRDAIITGCALDPNNTDAEFRHLKREIRAGPINSLVLPDGNGGEVLWVYYFVIPPFAALNGSGCGLSGLNLTGLARSTDGETHTPVDGAIWGPDASLCPALPTSPRPRFMLGAVFHDGFVYTYWSEGYRQNRVYVARVTPAEIQFPEEYEWFSVGDIWKRVGPAKFPSDAKDIVTFRESDPHNIGEFSIQFNEFVNGYVAMYVGSPIRGCPPTGFDFRVSGYRIQFSQNPEGPFEFRPPFHFQLTQASSEANGPEVGCTKQWKRREIIHGQEQCFEQTFFSIYGAYQLPRSMSASEPGTIYFTTSSFGHYNTFLMKLELDPGLVPHFRTRGAKKTTPPKSKAQPRRRKDAPKPGRDARRGTRESRPILIPEPAVSQVPGTTETRGRTAQRERP